jgi:hypothetical protein
LPALASEAFPWVIDGPVSSVVSLKAATLAETTRALPSRWTGIPGGTLLEWRDATLRGSPYQQGTVPVDITVQQSGWGYHFEQFGLGTIGKAWVTKRSDELAPQLYWSVKQYSTYCPGCILQIIVGIDDKPRACIVTTVPGPWPGRQTPASGVNVTPLLTGWGLDLPGRHRIQSRMAADFTCEDAMKCTGASCGWRTEGLIDVSPPVASSCAATLESLNYPIRMGVDIVSGTMNGQHFVGAIDYDASLVSKTERSVIAARNVRFCYRNGLLESFDAPPQLEFDKGTFVRAIGTGGDNQNRFGFNAGFDRNQFGRETEAFIRNGDDYFAYLNPATYVDGAGVINYSVVPLTSSCFWMENTSGNFAWVPATLATTRETCRAQDSCSAGGGKQSGGGCYKWATSASAPGEPW